MNTPQSKSLAGTLIRTSSILVMGTASTSLKLLFNLKYCMGEKKQIYTYNNYLNFLQLFVLL